jgi:hypothetical protein
MEQLVLDISSEKDAALIKELLKRFKSVEVNDFSTAMKASEMRKRIELGIKDADEGNITSWKAVKSKLLKQVKANAK